MIQSKIQLDITFTQNHTVHYEQNWFNQWPFSETHPNSTFPVGQNNKKAARPDKPWGFWAPCHLFCVFGLILPFYQYISAKLILPSISQNGHCLNQFCSQCNHGGQGSIPSIATNLLFHFFCQSSQHFENFLKIWDLQI